MKEEAIPRRSQHLNLEQVACLVTNNFDPSFISAVLRIGGIRNSAGHEDKRYLQLVITPPEYCIDELPSRSAQDIVYTRRTFMPPAEHGSYSSKRVSNGILPGR